MITKKICLIGDFAVGKTSLINRFVDNHFSDEYLTTVGVKLDTKQLTLPSDTEIKLVIWDIAGADTLTSAKRSYIDGASGYILVYDLSRPKTLESAINIQASVENALGEVPFVLAGNKSDLESEAGDPPAELQDKSSHYLRTSALSGEGVEQAFIELGDAIVNHAIK